MNSGGRAKRMSEMENGAGLGRRLREYNQSVIDQMETCRFAGKGKRDNLCTKRWKCCRAEYTMAESRGKEENG